AGGVGLGGTSSSCGWGGRRQVARLVALGQIRSIRTAVVVAALAGPVAVRGRGFGEAGCSPTRAGKGLGELISNAVRGQAIALPPDLPSVLPRRRVPTSAVNSHTAPPRLH